MKRIALTLLFLGCMLCVFACERNPGFTAFTAVRELEVPVENREQEKRAHFDLSLADKKTIYESYALARNSLPYTSAGDYSRDLRPLRESVCLEFWITDMALSYIESEAYRNDWTPLLSESPAVIAGTERETPGRQPNGSSSSASRYLSESTQRKIFYDITATQDQNPYSTEWGEGVKQAAADYYGVPRSTISDIILEGATKGWLLPDPP